MSDRSSPPARLPIRRVLARLTALALSTSAAATAAPVDVVAPDGDADAELDPNLELEPTADPTCAAAALGRGLAMAMSKMRPIEAMQIASTWTLSEEPVRRLAVAHALEWQFPLVGHGFVIDQLSRDDDAKIRVAAARAAWARRLSGGDMGVLDRLVEDPAPEVREIARAGRR